MREIKFRAIHKLTKKVWNDEELIFRNGKWYEDWRAFEDGMSLNMSQCEVMQYAGLNDSDEKEIYEGDILSFTTEIYYDGVYLETYHIEKVEFDEGSYWAHGHWLTEIIANDYGMKVIGNIYENPELLEREGE